MSIKHYRKISYQRAADIVKSETWKV